MESKGVDTSLPNASPLVFISHDTRDASIAEAFAKLLSSVSAGVLKTFRSSEKKGAQGIEYGVEWYPEIMRRLEASSDVVCLLTPNSINRPWILYEAGVAKGKLDTPVYGIALGVPLQVAATGPFAQFQNSNDSEESLTQLVMQLVKKIPDAEPDHDVVKMQVVAFRNKCLPLAALSAEEATADSAGPNVAELFEEVKVMFRDLPRHIERRVDPVMSGYRRPRRLSGKILYETVSQFSSHGLEPLGLLAAASPFKTEFPWLYEFATIAYRQLTEEDERSIETIRQLTQAFHIVLDSPYVRESVFRTKDLSIDIDGLASALHRVESYAYGIVHRRGTEAKSIATSWDDERLGILKKMWTEGKSASEIASYLGGVSRNAVIGKAHRIGLKSKAIMEENGDNSDIEDILG